MDMLYDRSDDLAIILYKCSILCRFVKAACLIEVLFQLLIVSC